MKKQTVRPRKAPKVLAVKPAGEHHQVVTLASEGVPYRSEPCGGCPWRKDQVGSFPHEAFAHSAHTAHDMSTHRFSCHESGTVKPAVCAGFLLRGANHNLAVRLDMFRGESFDRLTDGGHALFENYRAMAVCNGVDPKHPSLAACRD